MQHTVRNVPEQVDRALRRRARETGRSLNDVTLEALARGLGVDSEGVARRSLEGIAGSWKEDPDFDAALADLHRVEPDLWR